MTNEEKNLLFKDLCARLRYGVRYNYEGNEGCDYTMNSISLVAVDDTFPIEDIKPYLRSMPSMTEEEKWDFGKIFNSFSYLKLELLENGLSFHEIYDITGMCDITWNELNTAIDWLNAHYFDYRGLIEKGLALEAPKDMYKF